ncbi:hypothetical protein PROFUN_02245 [Planoprotostelium fungivorum]|uniref:F-box domain-containing protein n=1 Tax=Planoprotostelium fungivorum TaxID=1890364 RepID=A0A2P6NYD6_9EUKA|nr:hypothetical protein PROFUN_02245 [Planoprotostelium fungivorum]
MPINISLEVSDTSSLPLAYWEMIFSFLEDHWLCPLTFVCKEWRKKLAGRATRCSRLLEPAAMAGQEVLLSWCLSIMKKAPTQTIGRIICVGAAKGGQIPILRWWKKVGGSWCAWDAEIYNQAAFRGHLHMIKYLKTGGCPMGANSHVCPNAAYGGHREVIQWASENGIKCTSETFRSAAAGGHIELMAWLKEINCPWDEEVSVFPAYLGRLDVLQWLLDNGCPYDTRTEMAAETHPEVYRFILERSGPTLAI